MGINTNIADGGTLVHDGAMPTVPEEHFRLPLQASCPLRPEQRLVPAALGDAVSVFFISATSTRDRAH
jgi:hypothetical protein